MTTVLDDIVTATRQDLELEWIDWKSLNRAARLRASRKPRFSFYSAIRSSEAIRIIAEIKAASPSAGSIVDSPDITAISREYASAGAAAISVVTEPRYFKGSREWLHKAGSASGLPVVMKDFVIEPVQIYRAVAAGADAVLLLASLLDLSRLREFIALLDELGRDALVEVHNESELAKALEAGARIVGVNNRDLRDFTVNLEISERLAPLMPASVVRVAESGIRSAADVRRLASAGFHAFLVGEHLLRSTDRDSAIRELVGESS